MLLRALALVTALGVTAVTRPPLADELCFTTAQLRVSPCCCTSPLTDAGPGLGCCRTLVRGRECSASPAGSERMPGMPAALLEIAQRSALNAGAGGGSVRPASMHADVGRLLCRRI